MGIEAGRASSARAEKDYSKAISDYNSTKTPYYVGLASVLAGGTSAAAGLVLLVMRSDSSHATGLRIVPWLG
jgi:hypothetical protein